MNDQIQTTEAIERIADVLSSGEQKQTRAVLEQLFSLLTAVPDLYWQSHEDDLALSEGLIEKADRRLQRALKRCCKI